MEKWQRFRNRPLFSPTLIAKVQTDGICGCEVANHYKSMDVFFQTMHAHLSYRCGLYHKSQMKLMFFLSELRLRCLLLCVTDPRKPV